jgi:cytochrome c556
LAVRSIVWFFLMMAAVSPFSITSLNAHEGATGVVKERMELMVSLRQTMKALSGMIRADERPDNAALIDAATRISEHGKQMQLLFPTGSMEAPSVAKPEIWTDRRQFNAMADTLGREAQSLIEIVRSGDRERLMPQFRRVGASCSACHKSFRSKKGS